MADSKQIAEEFKRLDVEELAKEEIRKGRNYMLPKPPEPGEIMYCRLCGKPMFPEDFQEDPVIRKKEFKWQHHWACEQKMWEQCDRQTAGLHAERKRSL